MAAITPTTSARVATPGIATAHPPITAIAAVALAVLSVLHFLARIVAIVSVKLPLAENRSPRLHRRLLHLRPGRWWRCVLGFGLRKRSRRRLSTCEGWSRKVGGSHERKCHQHCPVTWIVA